MEQHGISKLDLKRRNRMQVLKILKQRGPTSRIDIAGTLELTRAAVTIITNEMIEQGIIQEIGEYKHVTEKAPRGRKKILIDKSPLQVRYRRNGRGRYRERWSVNSGRCSSR